MKTSKRKSWFKWFLLGTTTMIWMTALIIALVKGSPDIVYIFIIVLAHTCWTAAEFQLDRYRKLLDESIDTLKIVQEYIKNET